MTDAEARAEFRNQQHRLEEALLNDGYDCNQIESILEEQRQRMEEGLARSTDPLEQ